MQTRHTSASALEGACAGDGGVFSPQAAAQNLSRVGIWEQGPGQRAWWLLSPQALLPGLTGEPRRCGGGARDALLPPPHDPACKGGPPSLSRLRSLLSQANIASCFPLPQLSEVFPASLAFASGKARSPRLKNFLWRVSGLGRVGSGVDMICWLACDISPALGSREGTSRDPGIRFLERSSSGFGCGRHMSTTPASVCYTPSPCVTRS